MRVVLTAEDAQELQQMRSWVNGLGHECDAIDCVSFDNLRLRLSGGVAADIVIVCIGTDEVAALMAVKQGRASGAAVLTSGGDAVLRTQLQRAGAAEMLGSPPEPGALRTAIDRLYEFGAVRSQRGRLVVVTSAHPGVGVTALATGVAFALAGRKPGEAVLAELGQAPPELALDLDLKVSHGLEGLIRNYERSDPHMVRQVVVTHPINKLNVLAYSPLSLTSAGLTGPAVQRLSVLLREMFAYVVLDLGYGVNPASHEALLLADAVLLVSRPDVPGVRLARAYLGALRDAGVPRDRVKVAINRSGNSGQVDAATAKEVLSVAPVDWVPDDPSTVGKALELGRPLIDYYPRARVSRAMERLAKSLAPGAY